MSQTLIGDSSPFLRSWIAAGLQCSPASVTECGTGWELLWHLSERPFDLVVTGAALGDMSSPSLLAMTRTAGLSMPFIVILPFSTASARARLRWMEPVEVVDDWSDTEVLRVARDRLGGAPAGGESHRPRRHKLKTLAGHLLMKAAPARRPTP